MLTSFVGAFPGAAGFVLRRILARRSMARCGKKVVLGRHVEIRRPDRIRIGDGVIISDRCVLDAGGGEGSSIVIEDGVFISTGTVLRAGGGVLEIGEETNIGSYCTIEGERGVRIGRGVLLAAFTSIAGSIKGGSRGASSPVTSVGNGCWLGVRVRVGRGVSIGHDTVVGAHAVVEGDLPALAVAFGRPAGVREMRS